MKELNKRKVINYSICFFPLLILGCNNKYSINGYGVVDIYYLDDGVLNMEICMLKDYEINKDTEGVVYV